MASLAFMQATVGRNLFRIGDTEKVIPWADTPPEAEFPGMDLFNWEELDSWHTPVSKFFKASHYNVPEIDPSKYSLEVSGLVRKPMKLSIDDLKSMPSKEIDFTLECAGNRGFPWFVGGVYNAKWKGTPLAPILEEAGIMEDGIEVVFYGSDMGEEDVQPFYVQPVSMNVNFGRSMSVPDAMNPNNLLCYGVNGQDLPSAHGYPLRLIAPGWYGVANVKWLKKIEVQATRYMGKFMASNYVTIREEVKDGETIWSQSSVGRSRLSSAPAKVTADSGKFRIYGAAWGAPIERVEVKVDDGPWTQTNIYQGQDAEFSWKFWKLEWKDVSPGNHRITSRAIDTSGTIQPTPDDPFLQGKKTYWESNGQLTREIQIG